MTGQLFPTPKQISDDAKAAARRGIAACRAALAATRPPDDLRTAARQTEARRALARITGRTNHP